MFFRIVRIALLAAAGCALVSCEWPWKKKIPRATPIRFPKANASDGTRRNPVQVGTILMVNAEGGFVVIESGVWKPPESRTALKCFRDGVETGVLAVGEERRRDHVIADIVTGTPRKGDQVFK
jgi:hypothetical protein